MHNKSEARANVTNFITYAENQFSTKVKIIRSDNGIEFSMHDLFASKGIIHQTTCIETPEQMELLRENVNPIVTPNSEARPTYHSQMTLRINHHRAWWASVPVRVVRLMSRLRPSIEVEAHVYRVDRQHKSNYAQSRSAKLMHD